MILRHVVRLSQPAGISHCCCHKVFLMSSKQDTIAWTRSMPTVIHVPADAHALSKSMTAVGGRTVSVPCFASAGRALRGPASHCARAAHPRGKARPAVWRPALLVMETKNSMKAMMALAASAAAEMIPMIHSPKLASCGSQTAFAALALFLAGSVSQDQLLQPADIDFDIVKLRMGSYTIAVAAVCRSECSSACSCYETSSNAAEAMKESG